MNKLKNYFMKWIIPLTLVVIMASCEDRTGITSPLVMTTPTVNLTNPLASATDVPLNQNITASFSEEMNSSTITTATFTLMQGTSFVSGTVSYAGATATFTPTSYLAPNTLYTATITTGAKNLGGNSLINNYVWSFTSGAAAIISRPNVNSTDPANAATGVPINQKIAANFSVVMDASTLTASTFTIKQGLTPVPGFVSYSGTTAIFSPTNRLASNTAYTGTITTGANDIAGNALASNYVWSFTTGTTVAVTPPEVSSIDPLNAATGVPFNQKIAATFNKTMDASTLTASTFTLMQGTTAISGFVSYSGVTAIFAPSVNLEANTVYTVTITTGAQDLAGNSLVNNYTSNFTTGAEAVVTPPIVSSTDPINAAVNVPYNQKVAATFSKTMDASTITTATFTLLQGTTPVSGFISYSGATATFTPTNNLLSNSTYSVLITTGAKDLAGNALAEDFIWSFTTGTVAVVTPPIVSSTDPINASVDIPFNQKVAATFSKTMDASTITTATFTLMQGTTPVSGFVSYTGKTATFSPASNLLSNTTYNATITTGAKDLAGNALTNNYNWSFTTGTAAIVTPPIVSFTNPVDAAINVPFNQKVAATFSKTMDATTISAATFTLMKGTTPVSGFISYSGTTAILSPSVNLDPNTAYTATITTGAKDLAGNALASNYVWSFTTGTSAVSNPPTLRSTDPEDDEICVAIDKHITATFNQVMDASTITTAIFTIMEVEGFSFISGTVSYVDSMATFIPLSDLEENTTYTGTITTGAQDLAGNSMTENYVWNFTTVTPYTVLLSSNPLEGGTTSGDGTFNSCSEVTVTASPNINYVFVNWTESGTIVSTNQNYTFTLDGNRTLVANFDEVAQQYTVSLTSNPPAGGTTNGSGTYDEGNSVTVTATPNSEYTFTNWTESGNPVSANASYTFIISGHRILVANFASLPSGPASVELGSAGDFAILAGSAVSNIGLTTVYGDVGSHPTSTIDGFPPGIVNGTLYMTADPIVATAKNDLTTAYNDAQGRSTDAISLPGQLGGLTLAPGLYVNSTSSGISGTGANAILTLDAGGNANAVWIFKMGSTLVTDAGTSIVLAGNAQWQNIYWSVGTSATLGTNSVFYGNILADQSITLTTGAVLYGRALTRIAGVTLEANIVDKR